MPFISKYDPRDVCFGEGSIDLGPYSSKSDWVESRLSGYIVSTCPVTAADKLNKTSQRHRIGSRPSLRYIGSGGSMGILAVIRREEKKVRKQLAKLQGDLNRLQSAAKAMGATANRELTSAKKHVLSAAARAKMSKAAKRRWAKIKAGARKAAS